MADAGTVLANRYQLQGRATGGMREAWRATDLTLGRTVAVRLVVPEHSSDAERFLAAAHSAAQVCHPGIVQVHDYGQVTPGGILFLVTELVNASSLAAVTPAGPLDPAWVLEMLCQVTSALEVAHAAGLVHQDIKPGNLLLASGGVKLADLVLSRATVGLATRPPATPAADLYSLGMVAWECLTGCPPNSGDLPEGGLGQEGRPLPPLPAGVPAGVAALVADLTAADPEARPASATEVAARSRELLAAPMRAIQPRDPRSPDATLLLDPPPPQSWRLAMIA